MGRKRKRSGKAKEASVEDVAVVEDAPVEAPASTKKRQKKSRKAKEAPAAEDVEEGVDDLANAVDGPNAHLEVDDVEFGDGQQADSAEESEEDGEGEEEEDVQEPPAKRFKDNRGRPNKYINKQRVLVFSSRGIVSRYRHLMTDLRVMLPHSKKESKMDKKDQLYQINEICELKSCNACIFFETRKRVDLFMWFAKIPHGPSIKFHVLNVHTMAEMKLTGNALRGSRPLLSFDKHFDQFPHLRVMKEMFIQILGTPNKHPKSKPFFDHVMQFTLVDGKIWFRMYQIHDEPIDKKNVETKLVEIGPRFVLNPIRVFQGSFSGKTLWENPHYISPNRIRMLARSEHRMKYKTRQNQEAKTTQRKNDRLPEVDPLEDVFG